MNASAASRRTDPAIPLDKTLEFMRLIWALDHGLQRTSKRMRARLGLTGPQRTVIRMLGQQPGLPAGRLAALLHLHPSTLTGVLQRLEERGLIRRTSDPADARRARLRLTAKGRRHDVPARGTVEEAVEETMALFPHRRLRAASDVLVALAQRLNGD